MPDMIYDACIDCHDVIASYGVPLLGWALTCCDPDDGCDPSFSWQPCDVCGSKLGGDRFGVRRVN